MTAKTIAALAAFAALTSASTAFGGLRDQINLGAVIQPSPERTVLQSGPASKRVSLHKAYRNDEPLSIIDDNVDQAGNRVVDFFKNIDLPSIANNDTEAPQANNFNYRRAGRV
ncbi:MAG: hypothetical protein ACFBZ8_08170 [Opitutales bacterium]